MWSIGYGEDRPLGKVAGEAPALEGPVTYGAEDVPGDERHEVALPLEAGVEYGVEAVIHEPCKDATPSCAHTRANGCSVFEVDP